MEGLGSEWKVREQRRLQSHLWGVLVIKADVQGTVSALSLQDAKRNSHGVAPIQCASELTQNVDCRDDASQRRALGTGTPPPSPGSHLPVSVDSRAASNVDSRGERSRA